MLRHLVHAVLSLVANVPLVMAWACIGVTGWLAVLAFRVWPEADRGNCWQWALAKQRREGGYVFSRPVRGATLILGRIVPPHAGWMQSLKGVPVMQTEPRKRYEGPSLLWRWMYFEFDIVTQDASTEKEPRS